MPAHLAFFHPQAIADVGLRAKGDPDNPELLKGLSAQMSAEQLAAIAAVATSSTLVFGDRPKVQTYRRLLRECTIEVRRCSTLPFFLSSRRPRGVA